MNKQNLISYLERIDQNLRSPVKIHVYGSTALMLLGEEIRTSLDIDVAAPYVVGDQGDFMQAAVKAGLPINPDEFYDADHIEWIGPLRLCLAKPDKDAPVLWQGGKLTVQSSHPADLVASKLIRYDETDQSDIHFLFLHAKLIVSQIEEAVTRLPKPFSNDPIIRENLDNLRTDAAIWEKQT
jgi:hypothetical protein